MERLKSNSKLLLRLQAASDKIYSSMEINLKSESVTNIFRISSRGYPSGREYQGIACLMMIVG
ncbi:hypothetical protein CS542_09575 [Pedobacter sp. IW39]|nr:hypothetical protein CS542_09575 [Pedobacter sp. IW39]